MKGFFFNFFTVCTLLLAFHINADAQTSWSGTNNINTTTISGDVTIERASIFRNSTITIPSGQTVTITGNLTINANQTLNVLGTLIVKGAISNSGTVESNGTITIANSLTNSGNFSCNNNLTLTSLTSSGTTKINGSLNVVGDVQVTSKTTTIGNQLTVGGSVRVDNRSTCEVLGSVDVTNSLTNSGDFSSGGNVEAESLTSSGTTKINGSLNVVGDVQVTSKTTTIGNQATIGGELRGSGNVAITGINPTLTIGSAQSSVSVTMGNNAEIKSLNGDLNLGAVTVGTNSNIESAGSLKTTGGTIGNTTTITVTNNFTNGSTLTIVEGVDLEVPGNFTNNGTVNVAGNLKIEGDATNSGTISMQGGVLRVGTYETDASGNKQLSGGNLTLNDNSKLYYDNKGGKESNVEVRGNLDGAKTAYIKSQNGGKGNLAVSGTYSDAVEESDTYHPDWGLDIERTLVTQSITDISFKMSDNPNIVLATNNYKMPNIETGIWNELAAITGGSKVKDEIKDIQESYQGKPMNSETLAEIIKQIAELLPIQLVYFGAQCNGNVVEFSWETATETNNNYFTIEYSTNVANWYKAKTVAGAGTTQLATEYSTAVSVSSLPQGTVYFRLSQTDYDGTTTSFDVVAVEIEKETNEQIDVVVYPNPTTSVVNIKGAESLNVSVINSNGSVENLHQMADNQYSVEHLRKGIYTLVIETQAGVVSKQLVKQ